jgi:DNA-binding response OmpR family regulator
MHGGSIVAESPGIGKGSRFTVMLPIETGGPSGTYAALEEQPQTPRRVLVIDDNLDIARSLADYLAAAGHSVVTAADGEAGLALAQSFKPEAVILDIGLPGIDGFDVARKLRDRPETAQATLIAVSGYGIQKFGDLNAHALFEHYLVKPTDPAMLLNLVTRSGMRKA